MDRVHIGPWLATIHIVERTKTKKGSPLYKDSF